MKLDGYTFNRCRFDNCVLQTATGDFELVHSIVDNCRLQYFDPALRIIKLFTTPYNFGPEWGGLVADKHDDGTISIRKV